MEGTEGFRLELVQVDNPRPEELNMILGMSHFIKTVEDISEAMVNSVPGARFGIAFMEASGPCLIRHAGTDEELEELAVENMRRLRTGHTFILFMRDMFPLNVLPAIKAVPEVCSIICATANPTQVMVAQSDQGRGIMGVIDGKGSDSVEGPEDIEQRKGFLRAIGYKA